MEIVLIDTKSLKVRIEILMTGTKIEHVINKWQIVMIWQFVQNWYRTENKNICVINIHIP